MTKNRWCMKTFFWHDILMPVAPWQKYSRQMQSRKTGERIKVKKYQFVPNSRHEGLVANDSWKSWRRTNLFRRNPRFVDPKKRKTLEREFGCKRRRTKNDRIKTRQDFQMNPSSKEALQILLYTSSPQWVVVHSQLPPRRKFSRRTQWTYHICINQLKQW